MKFVNTVTDTLVGANYCSVLRDMIFDYEIIRVFTDIDVSEIDEASDAINRIEELLETTNIVAIVKANVEENLIEELNKAVDDNIQYRTGVKRNDLDSALTKLVNTIEKKMNDVDTDSIMKVAEMFSGITGEITPEKVIEVYSKSDIFKDNMKQVNAKRKKKAEIAEVAHSIAKSVDKK